LIFEFKRGFMQEFIEPKLDADLQEQVKRDVRPEDISEEKRGPNGIIGGFALANDNPLTETPLADTLSEHILRHKRGEELEKLGLPLDFGLRIARYEITNNKRFSDEDVADFVKNLPQSFRKALEYEAPCAD
jgi:hypothetical protein